MIRKAEIRDLDAVDSLYREIHDAEAAGLITTRGFRDTLELRREFKYDLYDLFIELPTPLVPAQINTVSSGLIRAQNSSPYIVNCISASCSSAR